jgi:hypothetical protein
VVWSILDPDRIRFQTAMTLAPALALLAACAGSPTTSATGPAGIGAPHTACAAPAGFKPVARRDPLKQPFATTSIWNMPIGRRAHYVPAGLSPAPGKHNRWAGMPFLDEERIVLTPAAPLTELHYSSAAWTGRDRCQPTGKLVASVPMPPDYLVPNSTQNNAAAFLLADGRTIVQTQPLGRCKAGAAGTTYARFDNVDLYGDGIHGAHGGSGLSAIGGTIRLGELRPGSDTGPRHVLKVNVYAKEALFECQVRADCLRWPAGSADTGAIALYGRASGNGNRAMRMGALLAIPRWKKIASLRLETQPGRQLAWTLQNYGAYVVDDTSSPGFALNVEDGPAGSKRAEFKADWGFEMAQKVGDDNPWRRDMQKIVQALHVVDNNGPDSIGGGDPPRHLLAAPIAP